MIRLRHRFERSANEYGRAPRAEDAADAKISKEQYQNIVRSMIERSSFSIIGPDGGESSLQETIADRHNPVLEAERAEEAELIHRALDKLTPMEASLVRQRFGLADASRSQGVGESGSSQDRPARRQRMSYKDVGKAYRISPLHARKIEQIALAKLRFHLGPGLDPGGN
jgi:RNA polymerase sigma factor (sigma-70 family)